MNKFSKKGNRGFAALILIIYISTLMLAFVYFKGIEYGHFFDEVKNKEYRLMAYYSAYSCIDKSFLILNSDYFFLTNTEIPFSDINCSINSVKDVNGFKMIKVHGKFKNILVFREAIARLYDDRLEIISIE